MPKTGNTWSWSLSYNLKVHSPLLWTRPDWWIDIVKTNQISLKWFQLHIYRSVLVWDSLYYFIENENMFLIIQYCRLFILNRPSDQVWLIKWVQGFLSKPLFDQFSTFGAKLWPDSICISFTLGVNYDRTLNIFPHWV